MGHFKVLDGLRAIAVLIVIVSHAGLGGYIPGGLGVTIFFFLSGYLITTLMVVEWEKTNRLDFRGFYLRRTVRIIPPMLLCILFTLAITQLGIQPREIRPEGLIWDFLFLSNYASQIGVNSNLPIPLWSLAVEEHFYLLFPLLFVISRRSVTLVLALIFIVLAVRLFSYPNPNIYYWSHTRIDSILFGCLLAMVNNPVGGKVYIGEKIGYFFAGCAMLLATLLIRDDWFRETIRYSIQGVGLFLIFNHVLRAENFFTKALSSPLLKPTANYSYVLYLIHFPMFLAAAQLPLHPIASGLVAIAGSYAFAAISFRFMELPLLRWRKEFQKRFLLPAEARPKSVE